MNHDEIQHYKLLSFDKNLDVFIVLSQTEYGLRPQEMFVNVEAAKAHALEQTKLWGRVHYVASIKLLSKFSFNIREIYFEEKD